MPIDTSDTLPSGDGEIDDRLRELEEAREELAVANEELSVQQEELLAQQDELLAQQDQLRQQNLALEAERQRYRELFELAPDGYLVTDRQGIVREANEAACALLGAPAWSVIDRPLSLYLPQGEHSVLWAHLRELRQGRVTRVHNWQTTLSPREGPLVDVLISIAPAAAPEGEVTGLRWLLRDITQRVQWEREREHLLAEQVRAEQALRANMEKYKVLFESFPLGITVTDEQGQIVEANLESERLLGVSQQAHREREVDGAEWEIVRLDGSPMPAQEYASVRALREKRLIEDVEMGIVRRDGDTTWISVTAAPVPVQGYGVAVAYGDISARVRAERALAESEARFRAAVANSSLVLSQTDRQLRYRWVANPHPDFDPAAVVGKRDDELEDSAGTRRLVALKQQVLDSGTGIREEVRFDRSDGIHVYDMTIEPLRDPAGQIVGVTTASVDITQRVRAEQRLQQYAERLRLQHQVDRAILSARSADEMVEAVLRRLPRLLPCLRAGVNLLDPEAGEVWLLATYSAEETSLDKGWHAPVAESLGEAMAQLARGERFLVDDMQARPPWSPLAAQLQAEGVRAEILQPLIVQGELIGAFGIGMTVPGPLPEEQLEAVGELADALAVGIQQMRLYDQVRRYATELEERVRTRTAQLATSEARFRAVYEQAAIGIALLDGQGRLLSTNPALQRMLGYQAHELQGLPLSALADAPHPASPEAGA
ncbi:MAG: PAS domain S-box protein, partial [Anaerolineae bacterium]